MIVGIHTFSQGLMSSNGLRSDMTFADLADRVDARPGDDATTAQWLKVLVENATEW